MAQTWWGWSGGWSEVRGILAILKDVDVEQRTRTFIPGREREARSVMRPEVVSLRVRASGGDLGNVWRAGGTGLCLFRRLNTSVFYCALQSNMTRILC